MEDHWDQDYPWEQGLVKWDADSGPLNGGHVIDEPIEPDIAGLSWSHELLLNLMTGPSTNFYVGPHNKHYMIPTRLLYYFSDYSKACLEGRFSETSDNAVWLRDVDPDVFQYLWQWLYTGKVSLDSFFDPSKPDPDGNVRLADNQGLMQAYQLLCRVHFLGERLLFDERFLWSGVQKKLDKVIERAKIEELPIPLGPDIVEEVLSRSLPTQYDCGWVWYFSFSLRPIMFRHLCDFQFCTTVDFTDYENCFRKDGGFAAELLLFLAREIEWAKKRGKAQISRLVEVLGNEELATEGQGAPRRAAIGTQQNEGIWVALRHVCTLEVGLASTVRAFSKQLELDSAFAANFLNHMAAEWLEIVDRWGKARGTKVDVAAERAEEERIEREEYDRESASTRMYYRQ